MSTYSGKPFTIERSAEEISAKFDDLSSLQPMLDRLSDEQRAQVGEISLGKDSIAIKTKQLGDVKFQVTEHTPTLVAMDAVGLPLPLRLNLSLKPLSSASTEAECSVDVDVPIALRAFIGPQLTKVTEMLSSLMKTALS